MRRYRNAIDRCRQILEAATKTGGSTLLPPGQRVGNRTPDSVVRRHLSPRTARAAPSLAGVAHLHRRGCDVSERGGDHATYVAPTR